MAGNVALAVDILAKDRASKTLSNVGREADRTGSRLGKMAAFGGKAFGGLALAAGGAASAGALFGVKTAASMEQARISFTTMLGSGQKADAFLKQLASFAAKTPFEFPELQTAASSLISAGIEANKVIPIMTTLGDVTSGMGTGSEGVKRATIALQQMSAAGRITGEDLNQLRDAGIPVYDLLAKATGKSKAEVVKLAQAGKLGSKELGQMMKALETGKGLERFSGLMDKQSQSLTGLWSTFKDTLGMGLANLLQPAIPALKSGLGAISNLLASAFAKISAGVKAVAPTVKAAANGVKVFLDAFRGLSEINEFDGGLRKLNNAGVVTREVMGDIGSVIRSALPPAKSIIRDLATSAVNLWQTVSPGLIGAVRVFATVVGGTLVAALSATAKTIRAVTGFLSEHKSTATALAVTIGALVVVTQAHAAAMAVAAAGGMVAWIKNIKVITVLTRTWAATQWLLNAAMTANPIGIVVVAIAALVAGIVIAYNKSETFRNIVVGAFHAVGTAVDFVRDHWKVFATAFATIAGGPMLAAIVLISTNFGKFKTIVTGAFSAVGTAASGLWNNILRPVLGFITNAWLSVVGALVNGAAKAFGWVPDIGGKLKKAADEFNSFHDKVNAALSSTAADAQVLGAHITDGVLKGITSHQDQLERRAERIGQGAADAMARGAKVSSPSKITTYVGKMLVEGLRVGIEVHGKNAASAARKLMGQVSDAISKAMAPLDRAIQASKDRLASLKDSSRQLAATARDNARSFAGILGFQPEEGKKTTSGDVLKSMKDRLAKLQAFRSNLARLAKSGLNDNTYRDLLEGGVDQGGAIAAALVAGGKGAVGQANSLQSQLDAASYALGKTGANVVYGDEISAAQKTLSAQQRTRQTIVNHRYEINVKVPPGGELQAAKEIQRLLQQLARQTGASLALP